MRALAVLIALGAVAHADDGTLAQPDGAMQLDTTAPDGTRPPLTRVDRPSFLVSVPLFALSSRAIAVEGELPIASRLSLSLATGVRDPASGDYGGYAFAVGTTLRGWLRTNQRGAHLALRLEGTAVHLRRTGMDLGTAYGATPSLTIGYRFVIKDHVTITPDLGYGVDIDFAHAGIPAHRRRTIVYGLSVGGRW
jgi:hypothetical protein